MPNPSPARRRASVLAIAVVAVLVAALTTTSASAGTPAYAPLDRPGPALSVPTSVLAGALSCHGDLATAPGEPVLLSPADRGDAGPELLVELRARVQRPAPRLVCGHDAVPHPG